jgi:hypothetical protein
MDSERQRLYRTEARTLGEVGAVLRAANLPLISVELPRELADRAVAAWERDDFGGRLEPESHAQQADRHRAGTLALIGLAVAERGHFHADGVTVSLHPELLGVAMDAADELLSTVD